MYLLSRTRLCVPAFAILFFFLSFAFGCSGADSAARLGASGDDVGAPDDDAGDDFFDDAGDDAGDDTVDDDSLADDTSDDTGDDTFDSVASVVLEFDPDPSAGPYYSGQRFTMRLALYDAENNLAGTTTNYTLTISPNSDGVTADIGGGFIIFMPPEPTHYQITATWLDRVMNSQTLDLSIGIRNQAVITLTAPARGLFTQDDTVNFEGTCTLLFPQPGPCTGVLVNGNATVNNPQPGETYSLFMIGQELVTGLNRFNIEAVNYLNEPMGDMSLSVLKGSYLENGAAADWAIGARANEGGLNSIEAIGEQYLSTIDLASLIVGQSFSIDLTICTLTITVTGANLGTPGLSLDAKNAGLAVAATLTGLSLDASLTGCMTDTAGTITLDASVAAMVALGVNDTPPDEGQLLVTVGTPDIVVTNINVTGFDYLGSLLQQVLDALAADISNLLAPTIVDLIQPMIEDALKNLDLSGAFTILDKNFTASAVFRQVFTDEDGLTAWMQAKIAADQVDPDVPAMPGSFMMQGTHPDLGVDTPLPPIQPYDFGAVINDDIMNQALYEVFRSGMLNFEFSDPSLTTTTLALIFPQLWIHYPNMPVIVRLEPLLQPVITFDPSEVSKTFLSIGEYLMHVAVQDPVHGEVAAFSAAVTLVFPVGLTIDAQGLLHIDIDPAQFEADVSVYEELPGMNFDNALVENFIPNLLAFLVPNLGDLLGGIALPSFEGYQFNVAVIETVGDGRDYLGMFGSLVPLIQIERDGK